MRKILIPYNPRARSNPSPQVVSPFQAILDYEIANGIPPGYVNATIQAHSPSGSWQKLERGEIPLDDTFFSGFSDELNNAQHWRTYCSKLAARDAKSKAALKVLAEKNGADAEGVPKPRTIDGRKMFWNMMRMSRQPDPWMFPALVKLKESGRFVVAALSNTIAFPEGVMDESGAVFQSRLSEGDQSVGEIRSFFDTFVSSAHVGLRKPDPKIYELALQDCGKIAEQKAMGRVEFQDVLFLDDIGGNLKAAKKLGMRTIKVNLGRTKEAVRELEQAVGMTLIDESSRL